MSGFDWDDANRAHIAFHGVTVEEIEEASCGEVVELDDYHVGEEQRFEDLVATGRGRILRMITTDRNGLIRVVTAFDASSAERRYYVATMVKRYE